MLNVSERKAGPGPRLTGWGEGATQVTPSEGLCGPLNLDAIDPSTPTGSGLAEILPGLPTPLETPLPLLGCRHTPLQETAAVPRPSEGELSAAGGRAGGVPKDPALPFLKR